MIQYTLKCDKGHSFESWFKSSAAFEVLHKAGHVTCAFCGSVEVEKGVMAPRVRASRDVAVPAPAKEAPAERQQTMAHAPEAEMRRVFAEIKKRVEENSDYVGSDFVKEARAMHLGDTPERPIYGEARPAEAKALLEDGVPVMPLPFTPTRKAN